MSENTLKLERERDEAFNVIKCFPVFFLFIRPIDDPRGRSNPQSDDNSDDNDVSDTSSLHLSVREDFSQSLKLSQMSEERRQKLREIEVNKPSRFLIQSTLID